jgi:putative ABC transport system permease protein
MRGVSANIIIKSAGKNRSLFLWLIAEMALTMAVLLNVVAVVYDDMSAIGLRTGVPEEQLAIIQSIATSMGQSKGGVQAALDALRSTRGVRSAAMGDIPLWDVAAVPISLTPDATAPTLEAYQFSGSQGLSETLNPRYVEGTAISSLDIPSADQFEDGALFPVVITQALANGLYGNQNPLGQRFYFNGQSARVVGVMEHLRAAITGKPNDDYSFVMEYQMGTQDMGGAFIIRTEPGNTDAILISAAKALRRSNPNHVQQLVKTMHDLRQDYFRDRSTAVWMLAGIAVILIVITSGGIFGLAMYLVQQRRAQIGMRRAMGARKIDIFSYFMAENLLITGLGVIGGILLTISLSSYMTTHYEVPPLHVGLIIFASAGMLAIGQLAVLWPAMRASMLPPVEAISGR